MNNTFLLIFLLFPAIGFSQQAQEKTFQLEEANIQFTIEGDWELASKTGKMEWGKVQYSFTHPHVEGVGREVNPNIIISIEKGSWFKSEAQYIGEKLDFHRTMDDQIGEELLPANEKNPIQSIKAYYVEGYSGFENSPYGQKLMLVTFWNEKVGFHMEIQTSKKDQELNPYRYKPVFEILE